MACRYCDCKPVDQYGSCYLWGAWFEDAEFEGDFFIIKETEEHKRNPLLPAKYYLHYSEENEGNVVENNIPIDYCPKCGSVLSPSR